MDIEHELRNVRFGSDAQAGPAMRGIADEVRRLRAENAELRAQSHGRELGDGMALGIAIAERDQLAKGGEG